MTTRYARRDFLKLLLASGLVAVADPEKLLWIPGEKVYFIPSPKPDFIGYYAGGRGGKSTAMMRAVLNHIQQHMDHVKPSYVWMHPSQKTYYDKLDNHEEHLNVAKGFLKITSG